MTRPIFFPFQYFPRKVQITHAVIDCFQRQGWFVPCIQLMPYRTNSVSTSGCCALFRDLKRKWKQDSGSIKRMVKLKVMSKSVNNVVLRHVSKMSGLRKCIYHWSFLKVRQLEGPATSFSSPAPSEILPLDVLRSTVAPAKGWLLFKLFERS